MSRKLPESRHPATIPRACPAGKVREVKAAEVDLGTAATAALRARAVASAAAASMLSE